MAVEAGDAVFATGRGERAEVCEVEERAEVDVEAVVAGTRPGLEAGDGGRGRGERRAELALVGLARGEAVGDLVRPRADVGRRNGRVGDDVRRHAVDDLRHGVGLGATGDLREELETVGITRERADLRVLVRAGLRGVGSVEHQGDLLVRRGLELDLVLDDILHVGRAAGQVDLVEHVVREAVEVGAALGELHRVVGGDDVQRGAAVAFHPRPDVRVVGRGILRDGGRFAVAGSRGDAGDTEHGDRGQSRAHPNKTLLHVILLKP